MKYAVACVLMALALGANAQVNKCKNADGSIRYSDAPCPDSASGGRISITDNALDASSTRSQMARERQSSPAPHGASGAAVSGAPERSPQCELAIRNANVQSSSASPAKIDGDRAAAAQICGYNPWPGPTMVEADAANKRSKAIAEAARATSEAARARMNPVMTSCDSGGCWDSAGNRYTGSAGVFHRSDGATCTGMGPVLQCN